MARLTPQARKRLNRPNSILPNTDTTIKKITGEYYEANNGNYDNNLWPFRNRGRGSRCRA